MFLSAPPSVLSVWWISINQFSLKTTIFTNRFLQSVHRNIMTWTDHIRSTVLRCECIQPHGIRQTLQQDAQSFNSAEFFSFFRSDGVLQTHVLNQYQQLIASESEPLDAISLTNSVEIKRVLLILVISRNTCIVVEICRAPSRWKYGVDAEKK